MPAARLLALTPTPAPTGGSSPLPSIAPTSCVTQQGTLCEWVYRMTDQKWLGAFADWLLAKPTAILLILVVAVLVRLLLHRAITRLAARAAEGTVPGVLARRAPAGLLDTGSPLLSERRRQRMGTMASVLRSLATGAVYTVAGVMILDEVGIPVGPILASAGILGVAIGFGSQTLVKDFLSGIFMILEDQYGVGDVIDSGFGSGSVEAVGLRVTRLRDVNGVVWYVRNGEILRIGNMSQGWARAVVDVGVAYGEDIGRVRELLKRTADDLWRDEAFADLILEEPEVWGVETLTINSVVVRVVVKTQPLQQWTVGRELRQRIMAAFEANQVQLPYQRPVWLLAEGPGSGVGQGGPGPQQGPGAGSGPTGSPAR